MLSSPTRRVVQAGCFVLFLWLFFHVCWPYHARPDTPGAIHGGWRFAEIEEATGWTKSGEVDMDVKGKVQGGADISMKAKMKFGPRPMQK